jgi:adenylate kinase
VLRAIIFGAPGSGKGTYASRLQAKLGIEVIVMGDMFREILKQDTELGKKVKSYVEKGLLVPDDIVIETLKQRLAKLPQNKGFLMDGYPRTLKQAETLETITKIDVILLLDVPDWIIIERSSTRRICRNCSTIYNIRFLKPKVEGVCDKCGGELYQRTDDTPEVIKQRLQVFKQQTLPILQYFKEKNIPVIVSTTTSLETPPETVVEQMIMELKKLSIV